MIGCITVEDSGTGGVNKKVRPEAGGWEIPCVFELIKDEGLTG
jgi:hypothetical protein